MKVEPHEKKAWKVYRKHIGKDFATKEDFREAFEGEWDTEEAYAEHIFNLRHDRECYGHVVPDNLRGYIDYEAFTCDLFMSDYFSIERKVGGIYVFRNI